MQERDNVSWSVLLGALSKTGDHRSCVTAFRDFLRSGSPADGYTLPAALKSCRSTGDVVSGTAIHQVACKGGVDSNVVVAASLVDMYAKCSLLGDARKVFDGMPRRDLIAWTVMIAGYAEAGSPGESLALFDRMAYEGVLADKVTMVTVTFACAKLGAMSKAEAVHGYVSRRRFPLDVVLGTAMVDMYAKCGSAEAARAVFDRMEDKNVLSWSAMISAYGMHGAGERSLELFSVMLRHGPPPNAVTFVALLYACSHAGLVDEGRRLFYSMARDHGVEPGVKHYTCMVDILGRAGRFREAVQLVEAMPEEKKDEGLWGALLGACRIHRDVPLAETAARRLLELRPQNPGYYVLLSNIYANAGRWEDVARVRGLMGCQRVRKKTPGWAWVEVDGEVHRFGVGDQAHPRKGEVYGLLASLRKRMEAAGYVPDTDFVLHDVDEETKGELLYAHSEKLAIAYGLLAAAEGTTIRVVKNLRVCGDCHAFCKLLSAVAERAIVVRDANRFHHFEEGSCSCGDYW
ncbi:unnamed protein product [Spirodela intermedia]|nr:unnamed protein product [Spirodela intermedia]CAA6666859.1 unnamed protein product [Spirodela intermedia]